MTIASLPTRYCATCSRLFMMSSLFYIFGKKKWVMFFVLIISSYTFLSRENSTNQIHMTWLYSAINTGCVIQTTLISKKFVVPEVGEEKIQEERGKNNNTHFITKDYLNTISQKIIIKNRISVISLRKPKKVVATLYEFYRQVWVKRTALMHTSFSIFSVSV